MTDVRKGQWTGMLSRDAFKAKYLREFDDPAFGPEREAIDRLEAIAWDAYSKGRKAPRTRPAGLGYADPTYELSDEWRAASERLKAIQSGWVDDSTPARVLLVNSAPRNDGTCPGEASKTWRMTQLAREVIQSEGLHAEVLDLSRLTSDARLRIHPCKGCVSTAMPLCHWPCSCYPNHALGQVNDWMNDIYEQWVAAHGVIVLTPVHWYQVASPLKLMMDRLVCADGGNPDPTRTGGKDPAKAKEVELAGWDYPKHLAGRAYGVVVHGDVAGIEGVRRSLCDWLDWMGLIDAGPKARLDRYIGYYRPYATSHEELDADAGVQGEVQNVARAVAQAVRALRTGHLKQADEGLKAPRVK